MECLLVTLIVTELGLPGCARVPGAGVGIVCGNAAKAAIAMPQVVDSMCGQHEN